MFNKKHLFIGLSIEFPLTFWPVIHELVHLKWPRNCPSTEQAVERLTGKIMTNLKPMLGGLAQLKGLGQYEKLIKKSKREQGRIWREFEMLDKKAGQILGVQ